MIIKTKIMKQEMKFTQRHNEIEKAKEILTKHGYYVGNLYQVEDVQVWYECTDNEALDVLSQALDNDGTANQVWESIRHFAEDMEFKEKED